MQGAVIHAPTTIFENVCADPIGGRSFAASTIQTETDSHIWHCGICAQLLHACAAMVQPADEGCHEAGMIVTCMRAFSPASVCSTAQVRLMATCDSCPSAEVGTDQVMCSGHQYMLVPILWITCVAAARGGMRKT